MLFSELIRFETELWNSIDARLRVEHNLPLSHFEPMQVMARRDACRVGDIARELLITVGGASKLVDRIEAAGLCRRCTMADDRRSSVLQLTPKGRNRFKQATKTFEEELAARLGAVLSVQALKQLSDTLAILRSASSLGSPRSTEAVATGNGGPSVNRTSVRTANGEE